MARIGKTLETLNAVKAQWMKTLPDGMAGSMGSGGLPGMKGLDLSGLMPGQSEAGTGRLREIDDFGDNPGNLRLLAYVPERLEAAPAMVVILHGCKQTAAGYDLGTGWTELADQAGFIVCAPEQKRENNPNACFSWFQSPDIVRERGEAASIHAMVQHLAARHGVDRSRIYVTGLSAGGAMTSVMLSAYPEVFAGGAVIAGLPYACATSVHAAFEAMARGDSRTPQEAAEAVRAASDHTGPWPRLSVWHGTGDQTVTHDNAGAVVAQWTHLTGLQPGPQRQETVDGQVRRVWLAPDGSEAIEEYTIAGLGHGTPLSAGPGDTQFGEPGPYLLEAGISSTWRIAQFWGLTQGEGQARPAAPAQPKPVPDLATVSTPQASPAASSNAGRSGVGRGVMDALKPVVGGEVQDTIRKALQKAGLL